jgi:minor histocompatibility antigen H13
MSKFFDVLINVKIDLFFEFLLYAGIFVALALRFDVSRKKGERYFRSAFIGYSVGVIVTIIVMNWFQAAQVS